MQVKAVFGTCSVSVHPLSAASHSGVNLGQHLQLPSAYWNTCKADNYPQGCCAGNMLGSPACSHCALHMLSNSSILPSLVANAWAELTAELSQQLVRGPRLDEHVLHADDARVAGTA